MKNKIFLGIAATFVLIQFFRPTKNLSDDQTHAMTTRYPMPDSVAALLKVACYDCHSNKTEYPWYAEVQPVAWWLDEHVTDGKRHLNFSDFTSRKMAFQHHKFEEMSEQIGSGEMPDHAYTLFGLHAEAKLTDAQRTMLQTWAVAQRDSIKAHYPADSLVMKRGRGRDEESDEGR